MFIYFVHQVRYFRVVKKMYPIQHLPVSKCRQRNIINHKVTFSATQPRNINEKQENKWKLPAKPHHAPFHIGLLTAIAKITGGLSYIAAGLLEFAEPELPKNPPTLDAYNHTVIELSKEKMLTDKIFQDPSFAKTIATFEDQQHKLETINHLQHTLEKMGGTLIAAGTLMSGPSMIAGSVKKNQPSMALASFLSVATAPLLIVFPSSIGLRGMYDAILALFNSGFKNKQYNETELTKGEAPHEYDLSFLQDSDMAKKALKDPAALKEYLLKLGGGFKFIVQDQKEVVEHSLNTVFQEINAVIKGHPRDSDFFKKESALTSLSSLLMYAGGIPLALMGGNYEDVVLAADLLNGTGEFFEHWCLYKFSHDDDGKHSKALLIGIPAAIVGDFIRSETAGFGLSEMGHSSLHYFWAHHTKNQQNLSLEEINLIKNTKTLLDKRLDAAK